MQGIEMGWLGLGLALLLLALVVALKARQLWDQTGLPGGEVIYTDSGTWYPQQSPLYASRLRLVGKPDYLVEQPSGGIIPVEVKSSAAPRDPYIGHVLQLAAYCALVEECYGRRPDHGIVQYRDRAFIIPYTAEMEADLRAVLGEMRRDSGADDVDRDHYNWHRCTSCGHRNRCHQRLG